MPDALRQCKKGGCDVALTGACSEGHDPPESCPHYGQEVEVEPHDYVDIVTATVETLEEDRVALPSGELLSTEEVEEFLRRQAAKFVTIVGESDSGKTTLICSIYERFLKGSFATYLFAGSRTLIGFEKRAHYARLESRRRKPDTPRTSISQGLVFFHLSVLGVQGEARQSDLLFSERAGETYRRARGNPNTVLDLVEVSKADRLVLLVDGGRVANPIYRAGAMQDVRQTLRAFLDGGGLSKASCVQVVTTKLDLLEEHPDKAAIDLARSKFHDSLESAFAHRLGNLSFWEVAARDPLGKFPSAHGVDALFADWARPCPIVIPKVELTGNITSEFDRLLLRTPERLVP